MKYNWSTRNYRKGDEERIYELWQVIHPLIKRGRTEWQKWWRWIYQKNPAGECLIRLAEDDGRIVGQHMMIPVRFYIKGREVVGCLGTEAMTHPDYRGQGIFRRLTSELLEDAARNNIVFSGMGMPNELSHPQWSKIDNYFVVSDVHFMSKPLNWKNVINMKLKSNFLSKIFAIGPNLVFDKILAITYKTPKTQNITVTEVGFFDERFDQLWNQVAGHYPIMTIRDSDYLNWRYNIPGIKYSIYAAEEGPDVRGYITLSERIVSNARVWYIADLITDSQDIMYCLISRVIEVCRKNGVELIAYNLLADKNYYRVLAKTGFISFPFIKKGFLSMHSCSDQIPLSFLQNPKNWLFQHADTDII